MLLYLMIMNRLSTRKYRNNHIVDYYDKQKESYGKSHKTAVIACTNKLMRIIFGMVTKKDMVYKYELYGSR